MALSSSFPKWKCIEDTRGLPMMHGHDIIYIVSMGIIAGGSAGKIMEGKGFGLAGDLVIGLLGALLGSWIFWQLNLDTSYLFLGSVLAALTGALLLLYALRFFQKRK